MKIISVDLAGGPALSRAVDGTIPTDTCIQDISVVVEHSDGTRGTYLVASRVDLEGKVKAYEQWASELLSLEGMVEK